MIKQFRFQYRYAELNTCVSFWPLVNMTTKQHCNNYIVKQSKSTSGHVKLGLLHIGHQLVVFSL